ncbi:MAG: Coenzyme F420 hydrogenase/dehydrogenase, beta subunit C-terminal domain [Methanobacteriaceae archaeon]|nr:Coenzyme F420 hydrogenase/dehydrogenase, beta subunit C-terminal domain [Methanobacteriaceae archaeon]
MTDQKIAMVGTPCEILAVSKMQEYLDIPVEVKIGLFCMENFSYSYLSEFLKNRNINIESIKKFRIEKGFVTAFLDADKKIKIPLDEVQSCIRKNCQICDELTSETSDISVGSIGSQSGWSTIIVRTEKGQKIIDNLIENKQITTKDLTQTQMKILTNVANSKNKKNLGNVDQREEIARPVLYRRDIKDTQFEEEISKSQFKDLKDNVIDIGACVLCGGCEYVCPENKIKIDGRKPEKKGKCPEFCHTCYIACPRMYIPEKLRTQKGKPLGQYKKILTAKANETNLNGQDGSIVTTILNNLLESEIVNQALVVDEDELLPWKPVSKLTNDPKEVIKSSGTKYAACPIFKPLKALKDEGE